MKYVTYAVRAVFVGELLLLACAHALWAYQVSELGRPPTIADHWLTPPMLEYLHVDVHFGGILFLFVLAAPLAVVVAIVQAVRSPDLRFFCWAAFGGPVHVISSIDPFRALYWYLD